MKTILVPLDGSPRAEEAIPLALGIAARHRAPVEFVTVQEPIAPYRAHGAPPYEPALDIEFREERRRSVHAAAESATRQTAVDVSVRELEGPVAQALARHADAGSVGLVVMTTVGQGGLATFLGSVADGMVRRVRVPLLIVPPDLARPRPFQPNAFARVLVPLDGSAFAEEILPHALEIAGDAAEYALFCVVRLLAPEALIARASAAARAELEPERLQAEAHLQLAADKLRARGLRVTARAILHANPAQAILHEAVEMGADLIAMTTHGHGAAGRLLIGSVAHKVLHASKVPVLLQRPSTAA